MEFRNTTIFTFRLWLGGSMAKGGFESVTPRRGFWFGGGAQNNYGKVAVN
jgi:hypothetical protein